MIDFTPVLRLYARSRANILAIQDQVSTQRGNLLGIVRKAANTTFGRDHDFTSIRSIADFQARVPLRTYDQFWNDYFKAAFPRFVDLTWPGQIPFFAVSSGTSSGTTKYIPYSDEMTASNTRAGLDLLTYHLQNRPDSKIFAGRSFMLGGSTDLSEQIPGVFSGDLSGIAVKTMRWWAKPRYFPPPELALLKNWEEKIEILAERSLKSDIRMLSGVPSWLLILCQRLFHLLPEADGKLSRVYPELEMLVHGGVNFTPYLDRFTELLADSRIDLREVYPASEGFIAVADRAFGDGMRLVLDHGIFFEFVPLEELGTPNPRRHWIENIETDVNYALVLSTCAGLWSYVIGDTVRFVERKPARLLVTGRTSYYLSAFGEHLIDEEIEDAVTSAARSCNLRINDYSVGPLYPKQPGDLGGHIYIVEFADGIPSTELSEEFAARLDRRLCERNEDYEAHRANGFGLNSPRLRCLAPGGFAAWMKSRGKLGGQNKVPRIITNLELLKNLLDFSEAS